MAARSAQQSWQQFEQSAPHGPITGNKRSGCAATCVASSSIAIDCLWWTALIQPRPLAFHAAWKRGITPAGALPSLDGRIDHESLQSQWADKGVVFGDLESTRCRTQ
ncbi:MAG: hypothetical protein R3C56_35785 [Pirellulaceae bacterium]